ncbi:MAG: thiolase family protein [Proteobacteria bacterium]|nr:thiolase family protein [Pseudomonadota bacterium]
MGKRVAIVGTGQTKASSGRKDVNGQEMINEAVMKALAEAELTRDDIDAVIIGNMDHFEGINYVDTWSVDGSGGFMKPIMKVTTGGTTGTTVAMAAYYHVASGLFDKVLAIGWEKNSESDTTGAIITAFEPIVDRPTFGGAVGGLAVMANRYMHDWGATQEDAARVAVRDRQHALNNPNAHLRIDINIDDVMKSPMISWPIKYLDMCPRTDAACAVIFASEDYAEKICPKPAWVLGTTNRHNFTFIGDPSFRTMITLEECAKALYPRIGITEPLKQFDVMELYLPSSFAGVQWIEALGLCKNGGGPELIASGATNMGGECPINPSGGVLSSNPIGATGLLRVAEGALQIMGRADKRQVPGAKTALSSGFGGCYWSDLMAFSAKKPN